MTAKIYPLAGDLDTSGRTSDTIGSLEEGYGRTSLGRFECSPRPRRARAED